MANVIYINTENQFSKEDRIQQGDYIFCEAEDGALDFWGIYSSIIGKVISLNGAGSSYIEGKEIYLGGKYKYWTITKRIHSDKVKVTIEENS